MTIADLTRSEPEAAVRPQYRAAAAHPALLAAIVMGACDPGRQSGNSGARGFTVRDSGDVEIVENHAPERPAGRFWTIDPEPEFVLGGNTAPRGEAGDSSHLIWVVTGLARLADGRVAVLSAGNDQLLVFEPSGVLSRTIGRRGRGPGEFERAGRLQYLPPDTLVVWQTWMGAASYFDTTGVLLKSRPIDLGRIMEQRTGANAESWMYPLPDGSFMLQAYRSDPNFTHAPGEVLRYPPIEFFRFDQTYAARSFGVWEGSQSWHSPSVPGSGAFPTFAAGTQFAAGDRSPWVYISDGDRNEIRQHSLDGTLVRIIRRTTGPVRVTEKAHRAWQQYWEQSLRAGGMDGSSGSLFNDMPKPDYYPAVGPLVVDTEGNLWVREWSDRETGLPDQWSVFDADGRWLGVVPGRPDLFLCNRLVSLGMCRLGKDYFLTVSQDEDGVERVEGYRIRRENQR